MAVLHRLFRKSWHEPASRRLASQARVGRQEVCSIWFEQQSGDEDRLSQARARRLENFHRGRHGILLWSLLIGMAVFTGWALLFRIDEVASARGEAIASSRVQVIQAVDGGLLAALRLKEGDRVKLGQVLARLDQPRVGASVGEMEARLFALQAKAIRLRAEVTEKKSLVFPVEAQRTYGDMTEVERALFRQRRIGLDEDLRTMRVAVQLSRQELRLTDELAKAGDASGMELLHARRALNEAEARLSGRKNKFLEDARIELSKTEDDMAQTEQVLTSRRQQQADSIFTAQVPGIVKNIRVTTVGGVLRAGEELMQIVPVDDELIVEAKVSPADIGRVGPGLEATIRFDPFDYTLYGSVRGKVVYVSADTLKEDSSRGEEIYYRVHVIPERTPVTTTTGRQILILPGMTAQVDIRTGERTLMSYLLKPLRRTVYESFGER